MKVNSERLITNRNSRNKIQRNYSLKIKTLPFEMFKPSFIYEHNMFYFTFYNKKWYKNKLECYFEYNSCKIKCTAQDQIR